MKTPDNELRHTTRNAGLIGLTAFGGALVGFVLQLLVAYYFGASTDTDAYFMAQSTSEMMSKLLLGGSITAVFLPLFVERLTRHQRQDAWELALNILHLTAAAFVTLIILLFLFADPFVAFIAPGFDAATKHLTVNLLRVLLPSFLFLYLVELITAMLHSLGHFAIPAFLRIVAPAASIIAIALLVGQLGIFALAVGVVAGSVLQVALLWYGIRKQGFNYRFIFRPLDPAIKKLLLLVYPFIFSVLVTQGAGITYRVLVSDLPEGSLAALKFAEKITQLLIIIFLTSVTMVVYPLLSKKAAQADTAGIRDTLGGALRLILFTTLPIVVTVMLLRDPIVDLLYRRGSFSASDAAATSIALLFLVIGLSTNGVSSLLGHAVLAIQETKAAVAVTIASQAVALSLFVLLTPTMQHAGLALASSLAPLSSALLYYLYLRRYIPRLSHIFRHPTLIKTVVLTIVAGIVVILIKPFAQFSSLPTQLAYVLQLATPVIPAVIVYLAFAHLWHIAEVKELTSIVQGKLNKWTHR